VLSGDPAENIEAFSDVVYTIRTGEVIFGPASLAGLPSDSTFSCPFHHQLGEAQN
jgi:hypothetical protein